MELTGRTLHGIPMVCLLRKVKNLKTISGIYIDVVETEEDEYRVSPDVNIKDLEIGQTYFFQTINRGFKRRPIQIVDYVKF